MPAKVLPHSYRRPVIPALLALISGIVTGSYVPDLPVGLAGLSGGLCLGGVAAWLWRQTCLPVLIVFFLLGYWSFQVGVTPPPLPEEIRYYIDGDPWHIIGVVTGYPEHRPDRSRLTVAVTSLARPGEDHAVMGKIRMTVKDGVRGIERGDRIAALARLKAPRNFNNPGGFDYERYLALRGISATAYVRDPQGVTALYPTAGTGWRGWVDVARKRILGLMDRLPSGDARGVLKALVLGDRSEISSSSRRCFSRIGISHLLAISGLHIGMVASLSFCLFRAALARFRTVLMAGWLTRGTALLSLFPVVGYGLLAGMSPSTQRAVIMVTIFLLALFLQRESDAFNTLAVAALVILLTSPTALFYVSFQLSFAAVAVILYLLHRLSWVPKLRSPPATVWKKLGLLLTVSASALLGTLPITLYYFNETSLIGLLVNCVMVPLVGFVVVPLGLAAVLFLPIAETLSWVVLNGAVWVMDGCLVLAAAFDRIPFAATKTVTPTLLEIFLYYLLLWSVLNVRRRPGIQALLALCLLVGAVDAGFWYWQRFSRQDLRVTVIDVGQGSATLLELPEGPCMLVDGGGFYGTGFDVGERIVAPFLWRKKIATVDTLVLSHPNADHLKGLLFIARHFNVEAFWSNGEPGQSAAYDELKAILSQKGIQVVRLDRRSEPRYLNGVRFDTLYPPRGIVEKRGRETWRTANNNSLVLKASHGKISLLFTGDIEHQAERELTALSCDRLSSQVLVVPHHGSSTSSTAPFLACVDPRVAVVSAGWQNVFGFPHREAIRTYSARHCRLLRTDQHGAVTIVSDGNDLTIDTFLAE